MIKANGGFPPIKYCVDKIKFDQQGTRERAFAPQLNINVNIREILKKNNKPTIPLNIKKNTQIDIVEDF